MNFPKAYIPKYIPDGTLVRIPKIDKWRPWTRYVGKELIVDYRAGGLPDGYLREIVFATWVIPQPDNMPGLYFDITWPVEIIHLPAFGECWKCHSLIYDELHYLCIDCRIK